MSDDLVKRARHNALSDMPHYASVELIEALADRIEELEAKLLSATMDGYDMAKHEYRDRIEELEAKINIKADFIDATINQLAASDQRIEELEAKLAELLAVSKRAVRLSLDHSDFKLYAMEPMHQAITAAELKGQNDG